MRRTTLLLSIAFAACGGGATNDDGGVTDAALNTPDAGPNAPDANPSAPDAEPLADALEVTCTPASGTNLGLQQVAQGLESPVWAGTAPGDARLFIIEQPGRIRILENGSLLPTPFLDIEAVVQDTGNEQGLLGMAFHPDYRNNGRFYVNYTARNPDGDTVIAEYQVSPNPDVANATEKRILVVDQLDNQRNHNGGNIVFGPDGYLYIGMGDGGGAGDPAENGENNTTLLAAMLRIDVDGGDPYGIPPTNPFASSPDGPGDPRREIWATGLRNPWRWSFDRMTGDLYIADVGQVEREEVDVQLASSTGGEDYGWDRIEGDQCYEPPTGCNVNNFTQPVLTYTHGGGRCSITGGYVYRGSCIPDIQGWYFYADYCTSQVWQIAYPGDVTPQDITSNLGAGGLNGITSFAEDALGELYILERAGRVYKIVPQ